MSEASNVQKNISIAFFLNASFTVIEIIGGILTNSVAILSDAMHDLGDTFSLGLSWYAERLAKRKPDSRYTYGYKRYPVMAAMVNAVFLLGASVFVLSIAIPLILNPEPVKATGMIWLAVAGIIFNGAAVLRLSKGNSINQKVVRLHLLEDTLGWMAVLVGAVIIKYTGLMWIDPLLGVMIAVFIIYNAIRNLKDALVIFLQAIPENTEKKDIKTDLLKISGVDSLHDIRSWSIDGVSHVYTLHVVARKEILPEDYPRLKQEIRKRLQASGFEFVTIEIDGSDEHCELENVII
ncbi:MAG: cation diffusion facilitator family transporter [Lentimicrobium sp.]|nr:cation diffusion facilitator family transporter [Lentimicrobium sp.]